MSYDAKQVEFMRTAIMTVYGKGKHNSWTSKCRAMAPQQVIAVYFSFKGRNLL